MKIEIIPGTIYKKVMVSLGDTETVIGPMNDGEQEQFGKMLREAASELAPVPLLCPYCGASATESIDGGEAELLDALAWIRVVGETVNSGGDRSVTLAKIRQLVHSVSPCRGGDHTCTTCIFDPAQCEPGSPVWHENAVTGKKKQVGCSAWLFSPDLAAEPETFEEAVAAQRTVEG
jgi:hypothetical protein